MNKSTDILNTLVSYFDLNGWPLHITMEKLQARSSFSQDDALPLWDVVEIERHRPILGTTYTQGSAMDAFETYYMRYGVNVATSEAIELAERPGKVKINTIGIVDSELSADSFYLSVEAVDATSYLIREGVSGEEAQVTSLDEAREFALSLSESFVDRFSDALDREFPDQSQVDHARRTELLSSYEENLKEKISARAKRAWEDREPWEE